MSYFDEKNPETPNLRSSQGSGSQTPRLEEEHHSEHHSEPKPKPDAGQPKSPRPAATANAEDDVIEKDSTKSAPDRWKTVSQRIRERAGTIAQALGRPHERDSDDLAASMGPEYYGATDDIKSHEARMAADEEQRLMGTDHNSQAQHLLRQLGLRHHRRQSSGVLGSDTGEGQSGATTPGAMTPGESGASTPLNGGLLSHLLRVYANNMESASRMSVATTAAASDPETETLPYRHSGSGTPGNATPMPGVATWTNTGTNTGTATPAVGTPTGKKEKVKWYKSANNSRENVSQKPSGHHYTSSLISASMGMGRVGVPAAHGPPPMTAKERRKRKRKNAQEVKLTVHIAAMLARQQYIMQLCRALMKYGAPTHRLEEYMVMTSNVLDVNAQFLYIPGCMFMSFDDPLTRTAEVKIIRVVQGLDLSRLAETHNVYKNVVHDVISVDEATGQLDTIMQCKPRYNRWILILLTGLASVAVGPYAFSARPIDLPIIFILGCLVGFMQHVLAPSSATYTNVLEVSAAILTSFLARAVGSISHNGERVFCFAAMAQSSIAMILPGFAVLSSSLELQSHQMNAGSIRMVFTLIYSLFLGYGVTVGTTIYGLMDNNATADSTCPNPTGPWGNEYIQHFPFVALFCLFAALINQAKPKQLPVTVIMGVCGYVTNYFSTKKLGANQVANTVGAFTIGLLANLYSRIWHGHAAAAIIPGIFTLVPSGLASSGSILSGLQYSEAVKSGHVSNINSSTSGSNLLGLGYGMIQTAIGISVGLFVSALIVYPHGKKRSGIFSL
ncbi:Pheromone-regulated membrane protein 10 [Penicillium diatomitis]|uniref:Pheromone-regulated membrane protein 10 n=1 Tax=Penicillium diatomitis TaxID=2819901 RepID=A0A9W9WT41_9EURO|nr:Pheromone-regulated membrane protein 10 [Penicillium diatomitis]KAJ5475008.1 Pheromone-regulated membrane protein 10 [Penicillium diatomitis]